MPASMHASTKATPHAGASSDGFITTPLPASSAGKIFQLGMAIGKFQGVIIPTTPTGIRVVHASLSCISDGTTSPHGDAALTGDEGGHVDGLLHLAAALDADLARLAAHQLGQLGLAGREDRADGGDDLRPLRDRTPGPRPLGVGRPRCTATSTSAAVCCGSSTTTSAGRAGFVERNVAIVPLLVLPSVQRLLHRVARPYHPFHARPRDPDHRPGRRASRPPSGGWPSWSWPTRRWPPSARWRSSAAGPTPAGPPSSAWPARLGYDGWVGLQAEVRAGLDHHLRPATERIREPDVQDVLAATAAP